MALKIAIAALCTLVLACGCMTAEPQIYAAKPWEGHYKTVKQMKDKTSSIQLDKDESIWVLSNKTLSRVLKTHMK